MKRTVIIMMGAVVLLSCKKYKENREPITRTYKYEVTNNNSGVYDVWYTDENQVLQHAVAYQNWSYTWQVTTTKHDLEKANKITDSKYPAKARYYSVEVSDGVGTNPSNHMKYITVFVNGVKQGEAVSADTQSLIYKDYVR